MIIMQVIPTLGMGGAEKVLEHLVKCQNMNGDEVSVVTFYGNKSPVYDEINSLGVKIICLNKKPGVDFSLVGKIKNIIKTIRPDVIHTHLYSIPYIYLAAGKTPIIHTVHSIASKEQDNRTRPLCKFIYNSKKCTVVAINEYVRESLNKEYGIPLDRIEVVLNGVDLTNCIEKKIYDVEGRFRIINVASLIPLKNHKLMIDAIKVLADNGMDVELNCLGDGISKAELLKYSESNGVSNRVNFLGVISDVFPHLNKSDVFILPSQYEGVPMSLIEAMGTGLPVIATNNGGTVDMVENGLSGFLIRPCLKDLVDSLTTLYKDKELRNNLGNQAMIDARKYSDNQMTQNYETIYLERIS